MTGRKDVIQFLIFVNNDWEGNCHSYELILRFAWYRLKPRGNSALYYLPKRGYSLMLSMTARKVRDSFGPHRLNWFILTRQDTGDDRDDCSVVTWRDHLSAIEYFVLRYTTKSQSVDFCHIISRIHPKSGEVEQLFESTATLFVGSDSGPSRSGCPTHFAPLTSTARHAVYPLDLGTSVRLATARSSPILRMAMVSSQTVGSTQSDRSANGWPPMASRRRGIVTLSSQTANGLLYSRRPGERTMASLRSRNTATDCRISGPHATNGLDLCGHCELAMTHRPPANSCHC